MFVNVHRPSYDFSPQLSMGLVSESLEGLDIAGAPQLCFLLYDPPLNIEY